MSCANRLNGLFALILAVVVLITLAPGELCAGIIIAGDVYPPTSGEWDSETDGYVGYIDGNGSVTVNDGSDLASGSVYLGDLLGETVSTGTVTVDGPSSTWTMSDRWEQVWVPEWQEYDLRHLGGNLYVGNIGNGVVEITNGAAVSNINGYIGYNALGEEGGGIGTVTLSGSSTWTNSGALAVGYGGNTHAGVGTLNILSGSTVTSETEFDFGYISTAGIGLFNNASGTITVDGPGSTFIHNGNRFEIGIQGSGTLNILNGGLAKLPNALTYVNGEIHLNGGTLTTRELVAKPASLTGTGVIETCGLVSDVNLTFDETAIATTSFGTAGTLTVDMSASSGNGELGTGLFGNGTLTIRNGASVYSEHGFLGFESGSSGTATVNAAEWNVQGKIVAGEVVEGGNLDIGTDGDGMLSITGGGSVSSSNCSLVGSVFSDGATGTLLVEGPGSTLTLTPFWGTHPIYFWMEDWMGGQLIVGNSTNGVGVATIANGATVNSYQGFIAGDNETFREEGSPSGTVTVDAATWNNTKDLYVGASGAGLLNIQNGGAVSVDNATFLSYFAPVAEGVEGTINFGPGGGTLPTKGLYMNSVSCTLTGSGTIITHGLVSDDNLTFDSPTSSTKTLTYGSVTVTLDVSDSSNAGDMGAGYHDSTGTIAVRNGATIYSSNSYLGYFSSSTGGSATVEGAGSTWNNAGDFEVGRRGTGMLEISGGGQVAAGNAAFIGHYNSSTGVATVNGLDSELSSEILYVGYFGEGELNVTGGGTVVTGDAAHIGYTEGSMGTVTVTGSGSTWTAPNLSIGRATSTGELNIVNGGTVVTGTVTCATSLMDSFATINFDGGTLKASASNSDWITAGYGTANIDVHAGGAQFDTNGHDVGIAISMQHGGGSPDGGVTKLGDGTLALTCGFFFDEFFNYVQGTNTYTGVTTVKDGALALVGTSTDTPLAWNPVLNLGGADIQSGKLIFNYAGGTSPADTIATILKDSFGTSNPFSQGNGAQIFSSTAVAADMALGWIDDGDDEVTVMYTLYGDSNLDGSVNGTDLNAVLSYYNQSSEIWNHGDFNYDGSVNGTDLNTVLSNYNQSLPSSTAAVPEPSTLLLLVLGLLGLLAWRKRFRRC